VGVCARCGERNRVGDRFCSACGVGLPGKDRANVGVRKVVTILFCDAVGSTALGEATDPETTRSVMTRYAETMSQIIRQHGGTVERFRGDEVMAVFGVPVVHEDDALRAIRAGREMQRSLARLNEELREGWGVELACRIGINTGEVIAGDPATGESFVTGDAVNLAKRLEQAAEPGGVLIGTATYPLVRDAVKVGPRERFTAKGKSEQVERMRLDEVDDRAAGYARHLDAPLVGRAAEVSELTSHIERLFHEGRCGVFTLVGPAGVGKSRLAREVASRCARSARIASGRCLAYGSGVTYWPLVELARDLGGLDAVEAAIRGADDATAALERLRSVLGELELNAPSDELFWGIRRVLELLAQKRPLLVCLEDIHWAEPTMLDLIEYIAAFGAGPIAVLCNARPDLFDSRPAWRKFPMLELDQLSFDETRELVGSLGIGDPDHRRAIAATAEGNPLFAEQLAAMVLESDEPDFERLSLPASIQALIAARLDALDEGERRTLERASVVGKEFWQRAVADLSPTEDRPSLTTWLLALARKGLIRPVRVGGPSADAFRFHHALIRDVAYAAIPKIVRADLHESFARWLRAQPAGIGEYDEIVGYHAEQAHAYLSAVSPGDARTRALAQEAARTLGAAGERAFARDDMGAAANLLGRAVELTEDDDPRRAELLFQLSGALWSTGMRGRANELLEAILTAASESGDGQQVWHALLERAARRDFVHGADADELLAVAEEARQAFEEAGDDLGLARAWRRIAFVQGLRGRSAAAVEACEVALVHARRANDGRWEGRIVDTLCSALLYGPAPVHDAVARCEELLAGARGRPSVEAAVLSSLAGLVAMQGDFDEAREVYERAKRLWEELGLRYAIAGLTQVGGELELLAGDPAAAARELRSGAEILADIGGNALQSALLSKALAAEGADDLAEGAAAGAEAAAGGREVEAEVIAGTTRSTLATRRGDHAFALSKARAAVARAEETDALNLRAGALVGLADALVAAGSPDEATPRLADARTLFAAKGNLAALARLDKGAAPSLPSGVRRE